MHSYVCSPKFPFLSFLTLTDTCIRVKSMVTCITYTAQYTRHEVKRFKQGTVCRQSSVSLYESFLRDSKFKIDREINPLPYNEPQPSF